MEVDKNELEKLIKELIDKALEEKLNKEWQPYFDKLGIKI